MGTLGGLCDWGALARPCHHSAEAVCSRRGMGGVAMCLPNSVRVPGSLFLGAFSQIGRGTSVLGEVGPELLGGTCQRRSGGPLDCPTHPETGTDRYSREKFREGESACPITTYYLVHTWRSGAQGHGGRAKLNLGLASRTVEASCHVSPPHSTLPSRHSATTGQGPTIVWHERPNRRMPPHRTRWRGRLLI